ncbi:MAG: HAD family hydrolase [Spirochaetaceae bacterium]|jgi:putative hydrolase of the HAD superfamily|nr:HAD family hydrolase [Spirochaetaceae bacterium]
MKTAFDGIAFDLDGTLYPNYRLYIRLVPFLFTGAPLLVAMGKARDALRRQYAQREKAGIPADSALIPGEDFYDLQARLMAEILGDDPAAVKERAERLIYRGWEPLFQKVAPFKWVRQTLEELRAGGLKMGLLSDFPPENKLAAMGLDGFWDARICSESVGCLKPAPAPFLALAREMSVAPERLLYVGNSVTYDIIGAKNAGMAAALIISPFKKGRRPDGGADFVFSDYRQLSAYVLN